MNIQALTDKLAMSGLSLLRGEPPLTTCPAEAASQASACGPEHGRVDEVIDLKRPDALRDVNAAWYRLATRFGLFGEQGEFLLFANLGDGDDDIDFRWLQVKIQDSWNMAGSTEGTINGPAFDGLLTMSPQGGVIIEGTTYQGDMASVLAVPNPHRALPIRRYAESIMRSGKLQPGEVASIGAWLDRG
ncbi:hypothetical protein AB0A05_25445 [Streptomyces sp. NPDC046374]|uniref:hypothetical protein n=1 Tax=Streptomyces sp. NPDC046374 TaxID=3154917 RepID=UPI0033D3DAA3